MFFISLFTHCYTGMSELVNETHSAFTEFASVSFFLNKEGFVF